MEESVRDDGSKQESEPQKNELIEWIKALLFALAIVLIIRAFIITPTVVSGPSMLPNFSDNQRLIVNKMIYYIKKPTRGEVIVFHAPEQKDYIKRVIALPGETIQVIGDQILINGEPVEEPYLKAEIEKAQANGTVYNYIDYKIGENGIEAVTVPEDHYFVMGDNRSFSKDSRMDSVGFIPRSEIIGRVDIVFWPLPQWQFVRHNWQ